jgi:hypothetical protein
MTTFETVLSDLKKLEEKTIEKFTDKTTGFKGEFESCGLFHRCIRRLNELEDWEKDNPKIIGDELMRLYSDEDISEHVQLTDEELFVNNGIKRIMIERRLLRKRDLIEWNIKGGQK